MIPVPPYSKNNTTRCVLPNSRGLRDPTPTLQMINSSSPRFDIARETNQNRRYALICQDEGLVPIVEPDISLNGDYDLETAIRVNVKVQAHLYKAMLDHGVFMEGTTLKPNMVNPGRGCKGKSTAKEIGEATVTTLRRVMPAAMPGVNFLSGGQTLEDAAARLCAINQVRRVRSKVVPVRAGVVHVL